MRVALIPVKELDEAKTRLAPVLDGDGRRELALAMFRDVLEAALACAALDGVAVVTTDGTVSAVAAEAGAEVLAEPGLLNEALTSASAKLGRRGVDRVLVLAADLPLATPGSLASLAGTAAEVAIVPAPDGGTNALTLVPGAIAFAFGPESARRHAEAAGEAGLRVELVRVEELSLDIDEPEDLEHLHEAAKGGRPVGRHTAAALGKPQIVAG